MALKIRTKLTCNNPGCLLPCVPRDNSTGHYTCHDGNKNCFPRCYGWKCLQTWMCQANWSSRKLQMLSVTTSPTNSTIHGEAAIIIPRLETLQPRSIISHKRTIKIRTKLTWNNPGWLLHVYTYYFSKMVACHCNRIVFYVEICVCVNKISAEL